MGVLHVAALVLNSGTVCRGVAGDEQEHWLWLLIGTVQRITGCIICNYFLGFTVTIECGQGPMQVSWARPGWKEAGPRLSVV